MPIMVAESEVKEGTVDRRLKVLVEAYECSPNQSHVPGSAWQILSRLAKWHDLWVITEETQYRDEVTSCLRKDPNLAQHMHFFFLPRRRPGGFGRKRPALPIREVLEYRKWLRESFLIAKTLHSKISFDLVHHLRGNSFREPGYLWRLPVPFVWGPTGGTDIVPWRLITALDWKGQFTYTVRNIINILQLHFSPRVRKACRKARCTLAQTTQDKENFSKVHGIEPIVAHEQACEPSIGSYHTYDGVRKLNVAWIGRCVTGKAMPLLLKAVSRPEIRGRIMLHIAGDGPDRHKWQKMATVLGFAEQCIWYGWLEQKETVDMLNNCDVLAFTSLLEATSTTVMQSLSLGVPVICLKHCGFGDIVTEECGMVIPVRSPRFVTDDFSAAIHSLIKEPLKVRKLSEGACRQADRYSWDNLAEQINMTYKSVFSSVSVENKPEVLFVESHETSLPHKLWHIYG